MQISDDIIKGCVVKNRLAQKDLYKILMPYLFAVANRYLKDRLFIKDVLQDSFLKIFLHIRNYDSKKSPLNKWGARIVINISLNYNNRVINQNQEEFNPSEHDIICMPKIIDDLNNEDLLSILKQMPSNYFSVFNLFIIDGYKHEEIASLLNISVPLSRKHLSRARAWVKKRFQVAGQPDINFKTFQEKINN